MAKNVDAHVIARGTPGFSGADLANLVNEAALLAARRGKRVVSMMEFEDAKDKVMMGSERKSMAMSEDEKKLTAYHEAGHAVVALHEPESDPIHKATIIPRGRALGLVMRLPERDRISMSLAKLKADPNAKLLLTAHTLTKEKNVLTTNRLDSAIAYLGIKGILSYRIQTDIQISGTLKNVVAVNFLN